MIREILFRGKRVDNGEWIEGTGFTDFLSVTPDAVDRRWLWANYEYSDCNGHAWLEIIPETIGQFTGLIDKNGNKIFENDVIDGLVVSYCGDTDAGLGMQAGWYLQRNDFESFTPLESNLTDIVDGNIFDNPELAAKDD